MRNSFLVLTAVLGMSALLTACSAKPEPPHYVWTEDAKAWKELGSGVEFPERLGGMVKTGQYQFEPVDIYGRAVCYEMPGKNLKLCVYLYRYGLDNIPGSVDPAAAAVIARQFDQVVDDLKEKYEDRKFEVKKREGGRINVGGGKVWEYRQAWMQWQSRDADDKKNLNHAYLAVSSGKGYFVKLRADCPEALAAEMAPAVNAALIYLASALNRNADSGK